MPSSPVVTIQLLLVRSLFDRATVAGQETSDVGNMAALLLADTAVETLVKQVLTDKQAQFGKEDKLAELLAKLAAAVPAMKDRPENAMARRLRDARNPVQHSGAVPASTSVAAHLRDAATFLNAVTKEAFGIEFAQVTALRMIVSEDLRRGLHLATRSLSEGKPDDAAISVVGTFEVFRIRWGGWLRHGLGKNMKADDFLPSIISEPAVATFGYAHPHTREVKTAAGSRGVTSPLRCSASPSPSWS